MRSLALIVSLLLTCGCSTLSPLRMEAHDLRGKMVQEELGHRYPDEFESFTLTLQRADLLFDRGEGLAADNVYRLALLKGHLMEQQDRETARKTSGTVDQVPTAVVAVADPQPDSPASPLPLADPPAGDSSAPPDGQAPEELSPAQEPTRAPVPIARQPEPLPEPPAPLKPSPSVAVSPPPLEPVLPPLPGAAQPTSDMRRFVGRRGYYTIKPGDTLRRVGARLGMDWRRLARINGLTLKDKLKAGQVLVYDNRKIVPSALKNGIVINIADRTLYLLKNGGVSRAYPVALGKPPKPDEDEDWSTPTGRFVITRKSKDPTWRVPTSIQEEMERQGKEALTEVPPGKDNPLGKYALKTSLSGIMIHSTNAPASVYSYASHGCIRVNPDHMEQLFESVDNRTPGMIIYQPVKLAVTPAGKVFLEINRDVYDRYGGDLEKEVRKLVARRKVENRVDWHKVEDLLKKKSGVPEDVTLVPTEVSTKPPSPHASKQQSLTLSRTEPLARLHP